MTRKCQATQLPGANLLEQAPCLLSLGASQIHLCIFVLGLRCKIGGWVNLISNSKLDKAPMELYVPRCTKSKAPTGQHAVNLQLLLKQSFLFIVFCSKDPVGEGFSLSNQHFFFSAHVLKALSEWLLSRSRSASNYSSSCLSWPVGTAWIAKHPIEQLCLC